MRHLLLAATAAFAPLSAHASALSNVLDSVRVHATHPPPRLSDAELRQLDRGDRVTRVDGNSIVGLSVVSAPRSRVWLSLHDPQVLADSALTEVLLSQQTDGTEVWYGRLALPGLLADRQWVVRSWVNAALSRNTNGRAWERAWAEVSDLGPARQVARSGGLAHLDETALDDAVVTPRNRGAWMAIALEPDRTLLIYRAETDLGGAVPVWLVRDVARSQVASALTRVADAADHPHPDVLAGDGVARVRN